VDLRHGEPSIGTIDLVAGDPGHGRQVALIVERGRALVVVLVALLVTAALGWRYAGDAQPAWSDQVALSLTREWFPMPRGLAKAIISAYDPVPLTIVIVVLTGVCLALGRRRLAFLMVAGPVLTGVAVTVAKPLIDRTKNGDLSYPSGHMGAAVAIAVVVALLLVSLFGARRWVTALAVAVPILWGAVVGLAMTVTNYHYWTDAVGGFCVAVAVVLSLAVLIDRRSLGRFGWDGRVGALGRPRLGRDAPTT
jgi:membrane-associated phospholipid phosphatase